jgi:hypothetical protein
MQQCVASIRFKIKEKREVIEKKRKTLSKITSLFHLTLCGNLPIIDVTEPNITETKWNGTCSDRYAEVMK